VRPVGGGDFEAEVIGADGVEQLRGFAALRGDGADAAFEGKGGMEKAEARTGKGEA
jgi:hypothetical protein